MVEEGIFEVTQEEPVPFVEEVRPPVQQSSSPDLPTSEDQHQEWLDAWYRAHFPDKFVDDHSISELTESDLVGASTSEERELLKTLGIISSDL